MLGTLSKSLRFDQPGTTLEQCDCGPNRATKRTDLAGCRSVPVSLMRKTLEHFFPTAILEVQGDRSKIGWDGAPDETDFRVTEDSDGLGLEIEWLGNHLNFRPESPVPLLPLERRLVDVGGPGTRPEVSRAVRSGPGRSP